MLKNFLWIPTAFRLKPKLLRPINPVWCGPCLALPTSSRAMFPFTQICWPYPCSCNIPCPFLPQWPMLAVPQALCVTDAFSFIRSQPEMHLFKETFLPWCLSRDCYFFSSIAVLACTYHHQQEFYFTYALIYFFVYLSASKLSDSRDIWILVFTIVSIISNRVTGTRQVPNKFLMNYAIN